MSYNNGYNQYKEQMVGTMTEIEMLTTLYDEAVKRLNRAKLVNEASNFDMWEKELDRANEIVTYLDNTLDRQYPISTNLHSLYEYMSYEILRAKISRRTVEITELIPMIKELRDTFIQASKQI